MKKIKVKVTTKASCNRILADMLPPKGFDELLKIYVTVVPENGKANKEVIKILSKYYKVAKSNISITHGLNNREKIIEVYD